MNSSAKILISVVAGTALGLAIGVLIAPEKGIQTRGKIRRRFNNLESDIEDEVGNKISEMKDYFSGIITDTKSKANNLVHDGQAKAADYIHDKSK